MRINAPDDPQMFENNDVGRTLKVTGMYTQQVTNTILEICRQDPN
jgi:hypothetical protein